jgi:hypothetical protein
VNRAGVLSEVASGVPATDFAGGVLRGTTVEPSAVNQIRNNTMQGAVVGVVGSGGALPTNWGALSAGLSIEVLEFGLENGIDYIDLKFSGTASQNLLTIRQEPVNQITAISGQTWTYSSYFRTITALSPPNTYQTRIVGRNSGGGGAELQSKTISNPLQNQRHFQSYTFANATTVNANPEFEFSLTVGNSYDFTIRIGLPQMELGSVATSVIKTTNSAQTRNADVITKTGLGSVLPQTEGWVYAEVDVRANKGSVRVLQISDGTTNNRVQLAFNVNNFTPAVVAGGLAQAAFSAPFTPGINRCLIVFRNNYAESYLNGVSIGTDSTVTVPVTTVLDLANSLGSNILNDPIHSYAIGSGAITDAQAIQLTTL